jgi:5,10-methenyltetrahydrofolate synthetase
LFLERELTQSIARNPAAELKKELRRSLLEARLQAAREPAGGLALQRRLNDVLTLYAPVRVGFYWPLKGEFDACGAIALWLAQDARREAGLPVILRAGEPLAFHAWSPDTPMKAGRHRIPEPASRRVVIPDLLFAPCVGFDSDGYRLGYGGGYYDRTLAQWLGAVRPVTVGVAWEACRTGALPREPHDIPLDAIVTEAGFYPTRPVHPTPPANPAHPAGTGAAN